MWTVATLLGSIDSQSISIVTQSSIVVSFLEHALLPPHTKPGSYNNHVTYRYGSERLGYLPKATEETGSDTQICLTLTEDCEPTAFSHVPMEINEGLLFEE